MSKSVLKYRSLYPVAILMLAVLLFIATNAPTQHSSKRCWEVPTGPSQPNINIAFDSPVLTVNEVKNKGFPFTYYREITKLCIGDEPSKQPESSSLFLFIVNLSIFLGIGTLASFLFINTPNNKVVKKRNTIPKKK